MINLSTLLSDNASWGDGLRYGSGPEPRPVVVWNATRRCTLNCAHCYSDSRDREYPGELSTAEAMGMIDALAAYGVPVLLFSGGEPLLRDDLFRLAAHASGLGIRTVLSTNGVLITAETARRIGDAGIAYVGVSLDGIGEGNDRARGVKGAFDLTLEGIRRCVAAGQRAGIRFTMTRHTQRDLPAVCALAEREGVGRLCVYHLVYAGRGARMAGDDCTLDETRRWVAWLSEWTLGLFRRGIRKEVLTVDNHADGVYIYLGMRRRDPGRALLVRALLRLSGGNRSGIAIANVDSRGDVHPDQFLTGVTIGNVRERPFGEIWEDPSHGILGQLRDRRALLKGRCGRCGFLDICNGNFRARAAAVHGDLWAEDPACYLTEGEISTKD